MKVRIKKALDCISLTKKLISTRLSSEYRYKIIDVSNEKNVVWFFCNQTNKVFCRKVSSISIDLELIGKLLSEQACYLWILIGEKLNPTEKCAADMAFLKNDFSLYAKENSNYVKSIIFDRFGNVIFTHPKTKEICHKNLNLVVSEKGLINFFHPTMACFLGVNAGYKNTILKNNSNEKQKGFLKLVSSS